MGADHFTPVAGQYATFRPNYPDELFDWLADIAPQRGLVWDCGAGSGQASVALASRFERVQATDISAAQLAAAPPRDNIEYRLASAEASGLQDHSADIVTIAQAMHWFDLPQFYAEVERVLKPGGIIAAWGYNRLQIDHAGLQKTLDVFYEDTIGAYWPPERLHVESNYRDLPFPFQRIAVPEFALYTEWSREHLLGYLRSWSAVGRFQAARGFDPVELVAAEIGAHWPEGETRLIKWPLFMHAGRCG
jgi:SAM-dependent methyltransferase